MPEFYSAGGISFDVLKKIGEITVGAGGATDVEFTGLDLDSDNLYIIYAFIQNPTTSSGVISAYVNGDTTASNYEYIRIRNDGVNFDTSRAAAPYVGILAYSSVTLFGCYVMKISGQYTKIFATNSPYASTDVSMYLYTMVYNNTANATSITLHSSVASGFGEGSKFILFGVGK